MYTLLITLPAWKAVCGFLARDEDGWRALRLLSTRERESWERVGEMLKTRRRLLSTRERESWERVGEM